MRSTRAGMPSLSRLKVDDAVVLLGPPPMMTGGDAAVVVTTTGLACFSTSAACGAPLCRSGVTTRTAERRPAEVGLNVISAMDGSSGRGPS